MLYEKEPPAAEAAALGFTLEEVMSGDVEVWPDNRQTVNVFIAMSTQWRTGSAGAIGLDYGALPSVMEMLGVDAADRPEVFDGLRLMEDAALEEMRSQKGKKQ